MNTRVQIPGYGGYAEDLFTVWFFWNTSRIRPVRRKNFKSNKQRKKAPNFSQISSGKGREYITSGFAQHRILINYNRKMAMVLIKLFLYPEVMVYKHGTSQQFAKNGKSPRHLIILGTKTFRLFF